MPDILINKNSGEDKAILCFGELLLRLSPTLNGVWLQHHHMPVFIGGAELNVATALAKWKLPSQFLTALPENYISAEIMNEVNNVGVDTSKVKYSGERIGTYYLPVAADLKHEGVIYDRQHSSFAKLQPGSIDWRSVFSDCKWFHLSAISPAVSESAAACCREAVEAASAMGLTISIDLNYRPKLWQYGKSPLNVMPALIDHCHVVMGNIWSARALLGIDIDEKGTGNDDKRSFLAIAQQSSTALMQRYPSVQCVANTFRFEQGEGVRYYASLQQREATYVSPEFRCDRVKGRIGSGDCFMAGLIRGICIDAEAQAVVDFAAAAAFGKLQEETDSTDHTIQDIQQIIKQHGATGNDHG